MTEHRTTYTAGDKPQQRLGLYVLYTSSVTPLEAHAIFLAEYGYPPTDTRLTHTGVLAGPVREQAP